MNLPTIKEQSLVETTLKGYDITLRRMTFDDTDRLMKYRESDHTAIETNLWLIALLMTGYDEDLDTRLKWLKSIEMDSTEDVKETDNVLLKVGVGGSKKK